MRLLIVLLACVLSTPLLAKPQAQAAFIALATANPAFGLNVHFDYSPTSLPGPKKSQPLIHVQCFQDEVLVYGQAGPADQTFLLGGGSSLWHTTPGDAHCVATLYHFTYHGQQEYHFLAATEFDAGDPRI